MKTIVRNNNQQGIIPMLNKSCIGMLSLKLKGDYDEFEMA